MADHLPIRAFVITSPHEKAREANVALLREQLPGLVTVDAVYPKYQKVPFLNQLIEASKKRTGTPLRLGEIGVLLSNRAVWRKILQSDAGENEGFLIMESDSKINDLSIFKKYYHELAGAYDLFFFGAWMGHMKLFRSTKKKLTGKYITGQPFIKTVYSAYGYTVNKKAARHLLKETNHISYAVDQYKKYIRNGELTIGGILPELISEAPGVSTIGHPGEHPFRELIFRFILDIKNTVICFYK
jgi:GR25 family glycosyltransferase involved in LPS biosynthesis